MHEAAYGHLNNYNKLEIMEFIKGNAEDHWYKPVDESRGFE